ncbi:MAG UNVERIFIED_CONTAM: hypothetical protein LVR18_39715 [Planctomycetaceae bacterium]|jgi:mono/diheme cytochrome c family protein
MFKILRPLLFPLLLTAIVASGPRTPAAAPAAAPDEVDYVREIQPLLARHCYECHGPDTQEGRLRLDRHSSLLRGGDSGEPAIIPTKPELSHLLRLVRGEEAGKRMPPEPADRLSTDQIRLLERWIAGGRMARFRIRTQRRDFHYQSLGLSTTHHSSPAIDRFFMGPQRD